MRDAQKISPSLEYESAFLARWAFTLVAGFLDEVGAGGALGGTCWSPPPSILPPPRRRTHPSLERGTNCSKRLPRADDSKKTKRGAPREKIVCDPLRSSLAHRPTGIGSASQQEIGRTQHPACPRASPWFAHSTRSFDFSARAASRRTGAPSNRTAPTRHHSRRPRSPSPISPPPLFSAKVTRDPPHARHSTSNIPNMGFAQKQKGTAPRLHLRALPANTAPSPVHRKIFLLPVTQSIKDDQVQPT